MLHPKLYCIWLRIRGLLKLVYIFGGHMGVLKARGTLVGRIPTRKKVYGLSGYILKPFHLEELPNSSSLRLR